MTIIDAVHDPHLFRSLFRDLTSWRPWLVWLKALFALPLQEEERALYQQCTGRKSAPTTEPVEVFTICGRRAGKSFIASLTAVYLACFRDYTPFLSPGERAVVMVLARDRNQAGVIFRYIAGMLRSSPLLEPMMEKEQADTIDLTNRVTIAVFTSNFKAIRGTTIAAALCDEIAFWQVDGVNPAGEVLTALRPAMVTIPGARLLCLSSPYARTGVLYEVHREFYGKDNAPVLVWQAPTAVMNPTIPAAYIARETERDPAAARAEWGAEFREDLETAFPLDLIEACVIAGRQELPPATGIAYQAFVDPSGGRSDSFTLAIGHRKPDGMVVVDLLKEWPAPFSPQEVVQDCCTWLKQYRCYKVEGDRYAGEWPKEQFGKQGVLYEECTEPKSELYLALIPLLTSHHVELPDDAELGKQLMRLERRKTKVGRDVIDHPTGGHDDVANAIAGVCKMVASQTFLSPAYETVVPGRFSHVGDNRGAY
jgi:hypothetical protein